MRFLLLLLNHHDTVVQPHFRILLHKNLFYHPIGHRTNFVFHLHGNQYAQRITLLHFISLPDVSFQDNARHGSYNYLTPYGIYAYNFKFKKAAFAIILLIMTMPTQVSALGFLQLITKMGLKNSFIPLIVPSIAAPAVFFFMKQYLDASLPMEIVEAARMDGAGEFYTFNKIVLPIMKPALAVQAIFSFVASWNNYFIPALVLDSADKKTLPILIAQLRSADFLKFDMGKVYMMVAIAILPVIIVYLLLSKFIVRGVALGGVKG